MKKKAEAYLQILVRAEFDIKAGEDAKSRAIDELYKQAWNDHHLTQRDGEFSDFTVYDKEIDRKPKEIANPKSKIENAGF